MDKVLITKLKETKKNLNSHSKRKLAEFKKVHRITESELFLELAFCILVANTNMDRTFEIWKSIGNKFLKLSEKQLAKEIKRHRGRFYNLRAKYIVEARVKKREVWQTVKNKSFSETQKREWLVKNIKGLSYKEASHFLRNVGIFDFAILDRHILRMLKRYSLIKQVPKTISRDFYLECERKLLVISHKLKVNMAELDFYLFYLSSGKLVTK